MCRHQKAPTRDVQVRAKCRDAGSEVNGVALCGEGRFVNHLGHRRMGVDGGVDFCGGELLVERESHLGDELGGVFADDVCAEQFAVLFAEGILDAGFLEGAFGLADGLLKLNGECFLEGQNFGFGQQSFAREELVEVAASVWIGRDHWDECIIFDAFVNRRFAGFPPAEAGTH